MWGKARRVPLLFVEDNVRDVELVSDLLHLAGHDHYELLHAGRMSEAIRSLQGRPVDVILLDLHLPDCTGSDAVRHIRRHCRGVPIVVLTGIDDEAVGLECIKAGAEDYLSKHVIDARALIRTIGYALARRREAQLGEELERLVEANPDALVVTDQQGVVLFANGAAERLFGKPLPEFIGQRFEYPIGEQEESDLDIARAGTEARYAHMRTAPVTWHGEPAYLAAVRDTTEARLLSEKLQRSQRLEAVGRLASGVAHDFNNIVTVVGTYCELIREQLSPEDPNVEDLEQVLGAVRRASGLTMQLLTFSKQQPTHTRSVDVNAVIQEVQGMLHRTLGEDIELSVPPADALWTASANPGQLEQVLMNLAFNARDAMPSGGTITMKATNVAFQSPTERLTRGDYVLLQVADTGHGMPPEVRERVFEPFFTTKEKGRGTGLGLATCYGIVRQCGGDIAIESVVGTGTTVYVWLPRNNDPLDVVSPLSDPPLSNHRGAETVLLVEDDPPLRRSTARALRSRGYTVLQASNGEEALGVASSPENDIRLIITDVIMPKMGGLELAARLKDGGHDLRVLFMTGYVGDSLIPAWLDRRSTDVILKPFVPEALLKKVRVLLNRRPLRSSPSAQAGALIR